MFQARKSRFLEDYYPKKSEAVRSVWFGAINCNSANEHKANYFIGNLGGEKVLSIAFLRAWQITTGGYFLNMPLPRSLGKKRIDLKLHWECSIMSLGD